MLITLSDQTFRTKPTLEEEHAASLARRQLSENFVKDISVEELSHILTNPEGSPIIAPGIFNGKRNMINWVQQQCWILDFDHDITFNQFKMRCINKNIRPAFCYSTFSNPDGFNITRFRAVFVTKNIITNLNEHKAIMNHLSDIFPERDRMCINRHCYFFGGINLIHTDYNATLNVDFLEFMDIDLDEVFNKKPVDIKPVIKREKKKALTLKEKIEIAENKIPKHQPKAKLNIFSKKSIRKESYSNSINFDYNNFTFTSGNRFDEIQRHGFPLFVFNGNDVDKFANYLYDHRGSSKDYQSMSKCRLDANSIADDFDPSFKYSGNSFVKIQTGHLDRINEGQNFIIERINNLICSDNFYLSLSTRSERFDQIRATFEILKWLLSYFDYQNETVIPNREFNTDFLTEANAAGITNEQLNLVKNGIIINQDQIFEYLKTTFDFCDRVNLKPLLRSVTNLFIDAGIIEETLNKRFKNCSCDISWKVQYKTLFHNSLDNLSEVENNIFKLKRKNIISLRLYIRTEFKKSISTLLNQMKSIIDNKISKNSIISSFCLFLLTHYNHFLFFQSNIYRDNLFCLGLAILFNFFTEYDIEKVPPDRMLI